MCRPVQRKQAKKGVTPGGYNLDAKKQAKKGVTPGGYNLDAKKQAKKGVTNYD